MPNKFLFLTKLWYSIEAWEVYMKEKDLQIYKEQLSNLTPEEEKKRRIYLQKLGKGEILGPQTGYSSLDLPQLKWYKQENINIDLLNLNVYENFLQFTKKYGNDHVLMSYYGKEYTRWDIMNEVNKHMFLLHNNLNLQAGDVISLLMLDVPEVLFIWLAANKLGIICNMIKFDENFERIKFMLDLTKSKYLFVTKYEPMIVNVLKAEPSNLKKVIMVDMNNSLNLAQTLKMLKEEVTVDLRTQNNYAADEKITLKEKLKSLTEIMQEQTESKKRLKDMDLPANFEDYSSLLKQIDYHEFAVDSSLKSEIDRVSVIVYTGGTTGTPKGVMLTNRNLNAMINGVVYGDGEFRADQSSLNILPPGIAFYYNGVLSFMCHGIKVDLISHFTNDSYPFIVDLHRPNVLVGGPILMEKTRKSNAIKDRSFIDISISGGDKLSIEEEEKYNDYLGSIVHQGWGMSECAAVASYATTKSYKLGTVGIPLINYEIAVFEPNTDRELGYNEIGELCVHSDTVMKGYFHDDEATKEVLKTHSDGKVWLHSQDLGYMDEEGRIFHKGRIKRMLTRGGNKVWLSQIEDVITQNPLIAKCCCVKADDEAEREVPVAHVVLNFWDINLDNFANELALTIADKLKDNFVPKYFVFCKNLPYTEVNKKVDYLTLEKEGLIPGEDKIIVTLEPAKKLTLQKK